MCVTVVSPAPHFIISVCVVNLIVHVQMMHRRTLRVFINPLPLLTGTMTVFQLFIVTSQHVTNSPLLLSVLNRCCSERKHIQMFNNSLCHRDKLRFRLFCITFVSSNDHYVISVCVVTSVVKVQVIHLLAGTITLVFQILIMTSQHVNVALVPVIVSSTLHSVISACVVTSTVQV